MSDWRQTIRLADLARGPVNLELEPDATTRRAVADRLGLESLPALHGRLTVRPWLDGAEIVGRFTARVGQVCGVTLEPFESDLAGEISLRLAPRGSPNAPADADGDVELDLDAPDPPDVFEGDEIDLAAYLVEHLALEIDPFPRKPGAEFKYEADSADDSPFAVLRRLKDDDVR